MAYFIIFLLVMIVTVYFIKVNIHFKYYKFKNPELFDITENYFDLINKHFTETELKKKILMFLPFFINDKSADTNDKGIKSTIRDLKLSILIFWFLILLYVVSFIAFFIIIPKI